MPEPTPVIEVPPVVAPPAPIVKPKSDWISKIGNLPASFFIVPIFVVGAFIAGQRWVGNDTNPPVAIPQISLPAHLNVPVGKGAVRLDAITKNKTAHVRWLVYPGDAGKIQILPYADHAQVSVIVSGTYWIGADLSTADCDPAWTQINPSNIPSDNPPDVPPGPNPSPVVLTPFEKTLQAAYDTENDTNKLAYKNQLAALYRQGVPYCADTNIAAVGSLYGRLVSAEGVLDKGGSLPKSCLPNVKKAIAANISTLGTNPLTPLTPDLRKTFADEFTMIAAGLDKIGALR